MRNFGKKIFLTIYKITSQNTSSKVKNLKNEYVLITLIANNVESLEAG